MVIYAAIPAFSLTVVSDIVIFSTLIVVNLYNPMNIDISYFHLAAQIGLFVTFITIWFAKGKSNNLPVTGLFSLLLNLSFPPAGWYFCWYWAEKKVPGETKE